MNVSCNLCSVRNITKRQNNFYFKYVSSMYLVLNHHEIVQQNKFRDDIS